MLALNKMLNIILHHCSTGCECQRCAWDQEGKSPLARSLALCLSHRDREVGSENMLPQYHLSFFSAYIGSFIIVIIQYDSEEVTGQVFNPLCTAVVFNCIWVLVQNVFKEVRYLCFSLFVFMFASVFVFVFCFVFVYTGNALGGICNLK